MTNNMLDGSRDDHPPSAESDSVSPPEHLRSPSGTSQGIHEINLVLTVILIEARAEYNWLNRRTPDLEAAGRSSSRLSQHARKLDELVHSLF
jgi:hypothetical protein